MTSLGEKRVRTEFNPSKDATVDQIKQKSAELINLTEELKDTGQGELRDLDPEVSRLVALAQTHYENAAMWAVKAATAGG
jgi:hypothetical protein